MGAGVAVGVGGSAVGVGGTEVAVGSVAVGVGGTGVAVGVEGRHPPNTTASPMAILSIKRLNRFAFMELYPLRLSRVGSL